MNKAEPAPDQEPGSLTERTMAKTKLELYVHIPFCVKKCAYCDFLSAPADAQERTLYIEALTREIRSRKSDYETYQVSTVFLGGGTPSVLETDDIGDIFRALLDSFDIAKDAEITMEVNPGTVTEEKAAAWKKYGVNRLSIGLQSVNDDELKMLGRIHTYKEFLRTWKIVRRAGFENVNIDLISAIPGQTLRSWKRTLRTVANLKPEHISAYSLIVEAGTPFYEQYRENAEERGEGSRKHGSTLSSGQDYLPPLPDEDVLLALDFPALLVGEIDVLGGDYLGPGPGEENIAAAGDAGSLCADFSQAERISSPCQSETSADPRSASGE